MPDYRPRRRTHFRQHAPPPDLLKPPPGPVPARQPAKRGPRPTAAGPGAAAPTGQPTHWDDVAEWYDRLVGDHGSEYHRQVVFPGALRMLGLAHGDRAVDLCCGQGAFTRMLHGKGLRVVGVDASAELLRLARERSLPTVQYLLADARSLPVVEAPPGAPAAVEPPPPPGTGAVAEFALPPLTSLRANHFDAVACLLAIQDLDPLAAVFEGVARLLRPGGRFLMVLTHPCFRPPKTSGWDWDPLAKAQYRRVERYLTPRKEPIITHPGRGGQSGRTWTFHRPLQAYIRALAAAGLLVDALEEWTSHKTSDSGPRAAAENQARKEIPLFMAIRAVKSRGAQA